MFGGENGIKGGGDSPTDACVQWSMQQPTTDQLISTIPDQNARSQYTRWTNESVVHVLKNLKK